MPSSKDQQRRAAYQARDRQTDKDALSAALCARIIAQAAYQSAETVMWYVGCKSEVRTLSALRLELDSRKRIVIPYCTRDEHGKRKLGLWHLTALDELTPGAWDIPEPPKARWGDAETEVSPSELDIIIVPGVAFDRSGGRLGNGAGYYDRLLAGVRKDAVLYGACFESQLFDQIEMEAHDIPMDAVITENNVYLCRGRETAR
ncbi:5-formyltetrahydrofolate cyclo-ligase [Methylomicrobium sp. Wu6]|uniref:5-formyltetrahydrofolate cyclo-ligase n=1 Tax=Methylomicrobium sp. Wu6 TaxID=3107928 RepID=UPI002DD68E55|nr:5-formyltetrahydrofolate cyclo-ligase [Methylomicrobium sp. Wu6]